MKALIVVASRHGATSGIADALAEELRRHGHTADVAAATDAPALATYDAVIIGSAVYIGQWLKEARQFIQRNQQALLKLPVWLFSSGPVGPTTPEAKDDPPAIAQLMKQVGGRGHRTFLGKLDPAHLGVGERFIMWNVKRLAPDAARDGDFRDWEAIRVWADEIAAALPAYAVGIAP